LTPFCGNEKELELICEFSSETIPIAWTIWPVSRSKGWLRKFGGKIADGDFAILSGEDQSSSEADS
jgi:hypothetical protein